MSTMKLASKGDQVDHALWVFALRYDAIGGATEDAILARIASHP